MFKLFVVLGSVNAFLSIALGAFGAHALADKLTGKYEGIYNTAVQYHMMHALGLIFVGILAERVAQAQGGLVTWSGWLMFIGILLFSGSLYILGVTHISKLGAITPLGGLAFLAGWILLIIAVIKA